MSAAEASPETPPPPRRRMTRKVWVIVVVLALALVVAWSYFQEPGVSALDLGGIRRVEVQFDLSWKDEKPIAPGSETTDSETIAQLLKVLKSADETQNHKCVSLGVIRLERGIGSTLELQFLPGHHEEWYEFRYGRKIYRVPRAEFVSAMKLVGVAVPLEPQ